MLFRKLFQVLVVGGAVNGGDMGVPRRGSGRRRSPRARVEEKGMASDAGTARTAQGSDGE